MDKAGKVTAAAKASNCLVSKPRPSIKNTAAPKLKTAHKTICLRRFRVKSSEIYSTTAAITAAISGR